MPARRFSSVWAAICSCISSCSRSSSRRLDAKLRRRVNNRFIALMPDPALSIQRTGAMIALSVLKRAFRLRPYDGHLAYQQEDATPLLGKQQVNPCAAATADTSLHTRHLPPSYL